MPLPLKRARRAVDQHLRCGGEGMHVCRGVDSLAVEDYGGFPGEAAVGAYCEEGGGVFVQGDGPAAGEGAVAVETEERGEERRVCRGWWEGCWVLGGDLGGGDELVGLGNGGRGRGVWWVGGVGGGFAVEHLVCIRYEVLYLGDLILKGFESCANLDA